MPRSTLCKIIIRSVAHRETVMTENRGTRGTYRTKLFRENLKNRVTGGGGKLRVRTTHYAYTGITYTVRCRSLRKTVILGVIHNHTGLA